MSPPQSVTVALSAEESRLVHEAAEVLAVTPEKLIGAGAVAFARLCGFRKTAISTVRRSPSWGRQPDPEIPEAILEIAIDPESAEQVEAAAGYVRWDGPEGMLSVTLPEYVVGATLRLIRETRGQGSPPSYRGLADQLFGLSRPGEGSTFRAALSGAPVTPPGSDASLPFDATAIRAPAQPLQPLPFEPPVFQTPAPLQPLPFEPPSVRTPAPAPVPPPPATPPPPSRPAYTLPRPDRPAYTLPRPERTGRTEPPDRSERPERSGRPGPSEHPDRAERPSYTLPRRGGAERDAAGSAGRGTRGKTAPPERGPAPARGRPSDARVAAPQPAGPGAWIRQHPLVLAGVGAAVLLLLLLALAFAAATAPTVPGAPHRAAAAPVAPAPTARTLEPPPAAGDTLRLDSAPKNGETAAVALKRWEDIAPASADAPPATPYSKGGKNHGKNIDALLKERYGRPKILADASLKPEAYDVDIAAAVSDVVRIYPVPPALVKAVIRRESNFNPNALSQVGAIGMMQLMPYTAKKVGLQVSDLWVPRKNILGGTRLLSALLQYYDGDVISALTAYNARPREPLSPLPKNGETPEYVAAVLRFYEEYNGAPLQRSAPTNPVDAPLRPGR